MHFYDFRQKVGNFLFTNRSLARSLTLVQHTHTFDIFKFSNGKKNIYLTQQENETVKKNNGTQTYMQRMYQFTTNVNRQQNRKKNGTQQREEEEDEEEEEGADEEGDEAKKTKKQKNNNIIDRSDGYVCFFCPHSQ